MPTGDPLCFPYRLDDSGHLTPDRPGVGRLEIREQRMTLDAFEPWPSSQYTVTSGRELSLLYHCLYCHHEYTEGAYHRLGERRCPKCYSGRYCWAAFAWRRYL